MASASYVQQFGEFLRDKYRKQLEELGDSYPKKRSLIVEFSELEKYNTELADELLENPDDVISACEEAVRDIGIIDSQGKLIEPEVRFASFPEKNFKHRMYIRDINSSFINKMVVVEGVITKMTDVRPKVEVGVFQCVHCGNVYRVPQPKESYGKLFEPGPCSCGRSNYKLNLEDSIFIDMQKMQVQEPLEAMIRGEQAKNIDVWLEGDLTNRFYPGDKVLITGILRLIPPKTKGAVYSIYLYAVNIE